MNHRSIQINNETRRYYLLEDFLSEVTYPSGRYEIVSRLPIFATWVNRQSGTTLVTFSAAVTDKEVNTVPIYSGWSFIDALECNILFLSDPTLWLEKDCQLSWYAGNYFQPSLQVEISKIIKAFSGDSQTMLFGASGGGLCCFRPGFED